MRRLLLALGAVSLFACSDSSGPGDRNPVGTWSLVSINQRPLPYTLVEIAPDYRFELVSNRFTLASNGTFTGTATSRETDGSSVTTSTETSTGTWTQVGDQVVLTYDDVDQTVASGTIDGDTIIATDGEFTFVYRRQ